MLSRLIALCLLALSSLAASAQNCPPWKTLDFSDGRRACLTAYPLALGVPHGQQETLEALVPATRNYVVAAPSGPGACPSLFAAAVDRTLQTLTQRPLDALIDEAKAECRTAMQRLNADPSCECHVIVNQGRSALTKPQFDAFFAQAPAGQAGPVTAPDVARAAAEDAERRRTEEQLAALQRRLAELEAARAATTAPSPAPAAVAPPVPVPAAPDALAVPRLSARALVIGNSRYASFGVLANPARDARAIADKLRGFGIAVDLVLDADRDTLIQALNEHARKAAGLDVSILFYAGHGVQVEGVNYLIPVNMRADGISAGYVKLAGIALNATLDYLPARTRLVFLDACRDNPASRSLVATRSVSAPGLAPVSAASGTLLSYATRDGATADDGAGLHSPYTAALLQHLDTPADISLVLRQVRQTVLRSTGGRQEPWEYGSLVGGQLVLSRMAR